MQSNYQEVTMAIPMFIADPLLLFCQKFNILRRSEYACFVMV